MIRRDFLRRATAGAVLALPGLTARAAGVEWPVGCFNRPWVKWPFDMTLTGVKAAGYRTVGLLTRTKDEPFIGSDATPEYLEKLKNRLTASGLSANVGAVRVRLTGPATDASQDVRKQLDNARGLGLGYALTFGTDNPKDTDKYVAVMSDAAAYAADKGIRLVMKPHGGISGAAADIRQVIDRVKHKNFSIWYDAGNIIHYTGKDPVAELDPIAESISGFCAKDCGVLKGEVMIQFGAGTVDFAAVFRRLKAAGFAGPVMVEGVKVGTTPDETTANARANREFLERTLASV